jgi:hypothetical protein
MEKRSRRRIHDLVTQSASQGLSENEIGCARISMMAKSTNALLTGRIQKRKTNPLHHSHLTCNTRPVHTIGSFVSIYFDSTLTCCSTTTGSVKENVEPWPTCDSTQILPPCISMMRLDIASPNPVPPFFLVMALSAC